VFAARSYLKGTVNPFPGSTSGTLFNGEASEQEAAIEGAATAVGYGTPLARMLSNESGPSGPETTPWLFLWNSKEFFRYRNHGGCQPDALDAKLNNSPAAS
jgi:hypothetical protein